MEDLLPPIEKPPQPGSHGLPEERGQHQSKAMPAPKASALAALIGRRVEKLFVRDDDDTLAAFGGTVVAYDGSVRWFRVLRAAASATGAAASRGGRGWRGRASRRRAFGFRAERGSCAHRKAAAIEARVAAPPRGATRTVREDGPRGAAARRHGAPFFGAERSQEPAVPLGRVAAPPRLPRGYSAAVRATTREAGKARPVSRRLSRR